MDRECLIYICPCVRAALSHTRQVAASLSCLCAGVAQTYAADEAQRPLVLEVLDAAVQLHLTVLRAWAFNDGAEQWQALQTGPGGSLQASRTHTRSDAQGLTQPL